MKLAGLSLRVVGPAPRPAAQPEADLAPVRLAEAFTGQLSAERPTNRSECADGPRPCPWISCRFNLFLDVRSDGVIKYNFPGKEPEDALTSCALDIAGDGPRTLDAVAGIMGMSKERARQIEVSALAKLSGEFDVRDVLDEDAAERYAASLDSTELHTRAVVNAEDLEWIAILRESDPTLREADAIADAGL